MSLSLTLKRATQVETIRELNHLFWIDEFLNEDLWDCGWSCREHSWLLALLLKAAGYPTVVMHGEAAFLPGSAKQISQTSAVYLTQHSWVAIEGLGMFDFSPKPRGRLRDGDYGSPFPIRPIVSSRIQGAKKGEVVVTGSQRKFTEGLTSFSSNRDRSIALLFPSQSDELSANFVVESAAWINSPLTDKLVVLYGEDIYAKAFLHVHKFTVGQRKSLRNITSDQAWERIQANFADGISETLAVAKLG